MSKALVTGAGGFIGSHLVELLVAEGFTVRAFVRYNGRNNWGWLESSAVKSEVEVFAGDIRDYDSVSNAVKGCDIIFHLAALIGIPYSYVSPRAYIETNITGTYNILQSARDLGVQQVLITSTSETYGTAQYVPIDENHPMVGQSPYSASKIAADQLALSYYRSFDLPVKIVRPFNTYGPRQSARAIIPTIITQMLSGQTEIVVGNIQPTRDFTFVKDTTIAFLEILKSNQFFGKATNVGMNKEISVRELVRKIAEILGKNTSLIEDSVRIRPGKSEVDRLRCDNLSLIKNSNWVPGFTLSQGLAFTIEWLKTNISLYKTGIYNI